ncbi:hypothetical protein OG562_33665 [Streptomyces sp. NBC_01275]|uniref:hypothetical protein n=1 Tax=Streptomyces sp. NBC_01275 TaxID=2903807 RepID=UPI002250A1EC|nr:hypothetical protein [Streptomyces sp. NBC_01275]MCX4765840.1 hypothetical protein [Streptomyces sp. NBC_01275]
MSTTERRLPHVPAQSEQTVPAGSTVLVDFAPSGDARPRPARTVAGGWFPVRPASGDTAVLELEPGGPPWAARRARPAALFAGDGSRPTEVSVYGHPRPGLGDGVWVEVTATGPGGLLALPFLAPEKVGSSVHAYALAERGNAQRVETAAAARGRRGARVTIGPGVIVAPPALDELSGPRKEWFEHVREVCDAERFAASDELTT